MLGAVLPTPDSQAKINLDQCRISGNKMETMHTCECRVFFLPPAFLRDFGTKAFLVFNNGFAELSCSYAAVLVLRF